MYRWHEPIYKEVNHSIDKDTVIGCMVCLAGSVLSKSLNFPIDTSYEYLSADKFIAQRMDALDDCRNGNFDAALIRITGMDESEAWEIRRNIDTLIATKSKWESYHIDGNIFKSNLRLAAAYLESRGY